jgi:hypothetical protein
MHGEQESPYVASKIAGPAEFATEQVLKEQNRHEVKHRNKQVGFLENDLPESFASLPFTAHQKRLLVPYLGMPDHFLGAHSRL